MSCDKNKTALVSIKTIEFLTAHTFPLEIEGGIHAWLPGQI